MRTNRLLVLRSGVENVARKDLAPFFSDGNISNYYPDFIIKCSSSLVVIVETKGLEDIDVPPKMQRLREWCHDINKAQSAIHYDYVFVDETSFKKYKPKNFKALMSGFRDYKD